MKILRPRMLNLRVYRGCIRQSAVSFAVAVAFLGLVFAYPEKGFAIIGGQFAKIEEYPFLLRSKSCGMTKVSSDLILTAAHCVYFFPRVGFRPGTLTLSYGSDRSSEIEIKLEVIGLFVHPQYFWNANTNGLNPLELGPDIAFLQVEPNLEFDKIPSADLGFARPSLGQSVTIIGYGAYIDSLMSPEELEAARRDYEDPVKKHQSLKTANTYIQDFGKTFFATADFDSSGRSSRVGKGDSGAPILSQSGEGIGVVVGIASLRDRGGGTGRFTRLDTIADWIGDVHEGRVPGIPIADEIDHKRFVGATVSLLEELFPELKDGDEVVFDCTADWLIDRDFKPDLSTYSGSCLVGEGPPAVQRDLPFHLMERLSKAELMGSQGNGLKRIAYTGKRGSKCAMRSFAGSQQMVCAAVSLIEPGQRSRELLKQLP